MAQLSIEFIEGSSSPSALVDGEFDGPLVRDFIADELRPLSTCSYFLKELEALPLGATYDYGFGNAIAAYVEDGVAYLEHVVADIPQYKLPLSLLIAIARAWSEALVSKPHEFKPQFFQIPE